MALPSQVLKPGALRDQDFFIYQVDIANLIHLTSQSPSIQIDNDSAFIWYQTAYVADIATAAQTSSTKIVPLVTINLNDGGSSRNIFNRAVPITSVFGNGENPFILPKPRVFVPGASILLDIYNFAAATDYNLRLSFIGIKDFSYKKENP